MTKIMESDMWQVICLENSGEVCSHETRLDDFTYLIDIDVIKVILTITAATQPLIFLPHLFCPSAVWRLTGMQQSILGYNLKKSILFMII